MEYSVQESETLFQPPLRMEEPSDMPSDHSCAVHDVDGETSNCMNVSNLSVRYGARSVVENISMCIPRNAVTAIMGPSGCGKSSFLSCLNRLNDYVPECQVTGSVCFQSENRAWQKSLLAFRRQVGMIFQRPNPFPFSVFRNLEFPLRQHGVIDREEIAERIKTVLVEVGLWEEVKNKLSMPAMSLSGGQQQRLCLARALILQPTVLLMDEPCSSLDPISTGKIEELIMRFAGTGTVVLVTHNISQARRVANYVALFWHDGVAGRLVEHGPAKKVFEQPKNDVTRLYFAFG